MSFELKNPFGIRGDDIVLIEDIKEEERGLNCLCSCPSCGNTFIAKMGKIKRHHFAHNGAGCDELKAFLTGMYMLLNKYLSDKGTIFLPPVILEFDLSEYDYITDYNIHDKTRLCSRSINRKNEVMVAKGVDKAFFDTSEIVYDTKDYPTAIIVTKNNRKLAIRITPPSTVCQTWSVHQYKELPTLALDMDEYFEMLYTEKASELLSKIGNDTQISSWIQNSLVEKAYDEVKRRSKEYYEEAKKARTFRKMREEQRRYSVNIHGENEFAVRIPVKPKVPFLQKANNVKDEQSNIDKNNNDFDKETMYRIGYGDVRTKFNDNTQQEHAIVDRFGTRWVQCEKCNKIGQDSEFACYGGEKHVNLGLCRKCARGK